MKKIIEQFNKWDKLQQFDPKSYGRLVIACHVNGTFMGFGIGFLIGIVLMMF